MTVKSLDERVQDWFHERRIIKNGKPEAQLQKLREEVDELEIEILAGGENGYDENLLRLEAGDVMVALRGVLLFYNLTLDECYQAAYEKIKDRTGYLNEQGIFVKDAY